MICGVEQIFNRFRVETLPLIYIFQQVRLVHLQHSHRVQRCTDLTHSQLSEMLP